MQAMNEYHWAQDKIDDVCNGNKKHREEAACERRLRQMAARREKEAARQARKAGTGMTAEKREAEIAQAIAELKATHNAK